MKRISDGMLAGFILITITLIGGAAVGGFWYGNHQATKQAYSRGYSNGLSVGYDKGSSDASDQINDLNDEYNKLVDDYNDLRTKALQYISATSGARSYTTCNSTSYGYNNQYSTSTCY